jgi:integrase
MPRPSKGPRLYLKTIKGRPPFWIIRDGKHESSTGCVESQLAEAQTALARYTIEKHDPSFQRDSDPNEVKVAAALLVYLRDKVRDPEKGAVIIKAGEGRIAKLTEYFGNLSVRQCTGQVQMDFVKQRGSQSAARRELEDLSAAINYYFASQVGGLNMLFVPWLPPKSQPRDRFIDRDEAAKLIWAAWRMRSKTRGGAAPGRYTGKHLARFILVALYTGTRCKAICNAALTVGPGTGYVDLDGGRFYRKAKGVRATSKRQPTCRIPPRLLVHMRRWARLGISKRFVVEWQGNPIIKINKSFNRAVVISKLGRDVIPHTLRHSSITWYCRVIGVDFGDGRPPLTVDDVSEFVGVTVAELERTYKHEFQKANAAVMKASFSFGKAR